MENANYMQVIPDSHFWTDLNQILELIKYHYRIMEGDLNDDIYTGEPLIYSQFSYMMKKYILTGLKNTKKNGYKLKATNNIAPQDLPYCFDNLNDMIKFVENKSFEFKYDYENLESVIKFTLKHGINLTNGLKMERKEIYNRIDGERDYQDASWGHRRTLDGTPDEEKPVAEWINYIEYHVSKAKEKVYHLDTEGATAELRKVAALAVRAMEIHGCPERKIGVIWNPLMGTTPEEQAKEAFGDCDCTNCDCKK